MKTKWGEIKQFERIAVIAIFIYYALRLIWFAFAIKENLPPDEITHLGKIYLYRDSWGIIDNSPDSLQFGLVTNVPYLYHLTMGMLLKLNFFEKLDDYIFLRLINVGISLLTIIVSYLLALKFASSWKTRVLFLVLLTNTMMFTFLSASVNYDNFLILFAVLSFYYLFSYVQEGKTGDLLLLIIFICAGCLSKITFLPLILPFSFILIWGRRKTITQDLNAIWQWSCHYSIKHVTLIVISLLFIFLNIILYGGNMIKYNNIWPRCNDVISHDKCMEFRMYARNNILLDYIKGTRNYLEAINSAKHLSLKNDREHLIRLIENERIYKLRPHIVNRYEHLKLTWDNVIKPCIFGIMAHVSMPKTGNNLLPYNLFLLLSGIMVIRFLRFDSSGRVWNYILLIILSYYLFLISYFLYSRYLMYHAIYLGVQGRYIFPILIPAYLLISESIMEQLNKKMSPIVLAIISIIFVLGDFPYFLNHATGDWFNTGVTGVFKSIY